MTDKKPMKILRLTKGLTQEQAAESLKVSKRTICFWEKGRTYPTAKQLEAMAELYGCTMNDILIP